jgi:Tn3 transposase DDE domain
VVATIKPKYVTASDLFRRLNSYSKQLALYHALKAFGQIPRSLFILRLIDDPALRQAIEKQLDRIPIWRGFLMAAWRHQEIRSVLSDESRSKEHRKLASARFREMLRGRFLLGLELLKRTR